jgi:hypothetical protein
MLVCAAAWSGALDRAAVAQTSLSLQELPPPQALPAVEEVAPATSPTASQVFPGGFPEFADSHAKSPGDRSLESYVDSQALAPESTAYPPLSDDPTEVQRETGLGEYFTAYFAASRSLPAYYYRPEYYNTSGIGARPLADYAPPGYEAREFQDAPGAPEFTQLTPPPPPSVTGPNAGVVRGMMPGSFLVPGSSTSFRLRGFARLGGMIDFDPIGSRDDFVTNTIPVPQDSGQNFNMSARYSRIAVETWTPTAFKEWNVHTFIEGDFFNGNAQAAGAGGNPFRLRFAFVDFGYFRLGQQNTVFMDGNSWPSTADFAGPRGLANQRRPGARVTLPIADKLYWAAGVEQPFSDITTNGLGTNVQDTPDLASHFRYEGDLGHVQLSGLGRAIGYESNADDLTRRGGWGGSASTVFHPWAALIGSDSIHKANPTGLERSRVLAQYTAGHGVGRYIQDTTGLGLDGQVDPVTGAFDLPFVAGWATSYEHWYNEQWLSNFTYSEVTVDNTAGQAGTTYAGARYIATSLWWIPVRNMSIAVEFLHGVRENLDGQSADANRIQTLFQYNF